MAQEITKSVHIRIASAGPGTVIIDRPGSTVDTHCEVTGVPMEAHATTVIKQVSRLIFWPWPKSIAWASIAHLNQGALVRSPKGGR